MHDSWGPQIALIAADCTFPTDENEDDQQLADQNDDELQGPVISVLASQLLLAKPMIGRSLQDNTAQVSYHQQQPLINRKIASIISSVSHGARISLRLSSLLVEVIFESLKLSASTTCAIARRGIITALTSARTVHMLAMGKDNSGTSLSFYKALDKYTSAGVYLVHNVFSLAELLTHTTFHLASTSIRFSLHAAEEFVQLLDGLFGETETSKALAAFICLVKKEIKGTEDELCWNFKYGRISAIGQITKALTAYCCLQYVNRKRWRKSLKLTALFEGHVRTDDPCHYPECKCDSLGDSLGGMNLVDDAYLAPVHAFSENHDMASKARILELMNRRRMSNPEGDRSRGLRVIDVKDDIHKSGMMAQHRKIPFDRLAPAAEIAETGLLQTHASSHALNKAQVGRMVNMFKSIHNKKPPRHLTTTTTTDKSPPTSMIKAVASPAPPCSPFCSRKLQITANASNPRQELFRRIIRYVRFASGAYGTNFLKILGIGRARDMMLEAGGDSHHNHQSFAFHADVPIEHILNSSFHEPTPLHPPSLIAPVHYLVIDTQTSSVVVSLRGTLGFSDLITDLTGNYTDYASKDGLSGKVHAGMLASAEKVARGPVREAVIEALARNPTFDLVLTGHSLGGGVAALLALIWSRRDMDDESGETSFFTDESVGLPPRKISCFVYGVPAVMSIGLATDCRDLITSVINRHDVVPCLSLGLIRDFRNVAVNLCNEKGVAERVIGRILGVFKNQTAGQHQPAYLEDEDLWHWALLKTLKADMRAEKLFPPGSVYWINAYPAKVTVTDPVPSSTTTPQHQPPSSPTTPQLPPPPSTSSKPSLAKSLSIHAVEDVEMAFSEFTFSKTMFFDHSPHSYESAMQALNIAVKTHAWP